jgi:tetratricopeptide (TPR) repeat protein
LSGCGEQVHKEGESLASGQTSNPVELTKRAISIQESGVYDEAITLLNQALELDPLYAPAYFQKGSVFEEWDKREEALEAYLKAVELNPNYDDARLGLASVYDKSVLNHLAVEQYLKVAETRKGDPEIHFKIALEYWYLQNIPKTQEHYAKVVKIEPEHMQAHLNLISVYERMRNWERAIEEIEIVKRLAGKTSNQQAMKIAVNKLTFIEGRMNLTKQEMKRKSEPPFD